MLAELFASLTTPFPRTPQRMGYLAEQIAIRARERRCRSAWAPHLAASRTMMLEVAHGCQRRERCVVVGAGLCLDVPVIELARLFRDVVLLDVGFLERGGPANLRRIVWDATGSLERWHADPAMTDTQALDVDDPGWPPDAGEPDLTISASILSQLHLRPALWLGRGRNRAADFEDRLADRLGRLHLAWLAGRPGRRLLITDLAEITQDRRAQTVGETPTAASRLGLPVPDRHWIWNLAPIPEVSRDQGISHGVGAWIDPSST
jgi:hypothetical protein